MEVNIEKYTKLAEKKIRTGGPGSVRRKKQPVHKTGAVDNKLLMNKFQSLGIREIGGFEEVNLFKTDGTIIHFDHPRVLTAQSTFVVSGNAQHKTLQELLPGILNHLGADNIASLKKIAEQYAKKEATKESEDVPDLVGNFETAASN